MGDKLQLGALDVETKKYTPPSEAIKRREYKCVDCDKRVILRKGEVRRPHFAHYSQTNVCSYYDHPNEAQVHKDAKLLMQKMLNEKRLIYFKRECLDCKNDYAFQDTASFDYKEGDEAVLEYRDPDNKWIADVALINNNQVRCIVEIKNTHKTVTPRPEPWFEVDARDFINTINELTEEILKDPEEYSFQNEKDYVFEIPCLRKELHPRCYGSFCYREKWVRRIPGYDKNQSDNACILCKIEEYDPITDGCTGKFQKGEIRVCFDCIRKEFYEKKLRELYSGEIKKTIPDYYKKKINSIPILLRKVGMEAKWQQEISCAMCTLNRYSPQYENKNYYAICKICYSLDEENNKKLLETKVITKNEYLMSD